MNFEPSAERGAALDRTMRERLADTLDYMFGEIGEPLGIGANDTRRLTAEVRAGPQSPNRFGAYYDLVLALEGDRVGDAKGFLKELFLPTDATGTRISAIDNRHEAEAARYRRLLVPEADMARQPDAALLADTVARADRAFDLLDRGFPAMAAEIRELLREIVIAAGPEDPKALTFDGSSSYMLWGAMLLNARGQKTALDTAQALAHESGHNLLFGFCSSGTLVENADDELFSSPLRTDARPMDGVFHATYVVARMHQTLSRLLGSGVLSSEQTEFALKDLEAHRRNFDAGDEVIREGGRLTPLGAEVIESACAYMATTA